MTPTEDADFETAARTLYASPLANFTSARNTAARTNPQLKKLPKPSVGAWAVNMLASSQPTVLERVTELAHELRQAQSSGDAEQMRDLARQRRQVIRTVTDAATDLAESIGQRVSTTARTEIETTLHAAVSSPDAAAAVASGLLVHGISADGIDVPDLSDAVIGRHSPKADVAAPTRPNPALKRARAALESAISDLNIAQAAFDAQTERRNVIDTRVEEAKRALQQVEAEAESVRHDVGLATKARDTATRSAEHARRVLDGLEP